MVIALASQNKIIINGSVDFMKKLLESFSFNLSMLQNISTLLNHLEVNNIPIKNFHEHVEQEKINKAKDDKIANNKRKKIKLQWDKIAVKCPDCKTPMGLFPVNTNPGNQVGDDLRSLWFCDKCEHAEYSKRSADEILKERRA